MFSSSGSNLEVGLGERFVVEITNITPLLPTYLHLLVSAIFPVYTAAHASLRRPISASRAKTSDSFDDKGHDSEEDSSSPLEALTMSDAILFPILAGIMLSLLYVLIKWLEDPTILNRLLGLYFSWIGTFFTFKFIKDTLHLLRAFVFPSQFSFRGHLYKAQLDTPRYLAVPSADSKTPDSGDVVLQNEAEETSLTSTTHFKLYWKTRQMFYNQAKCVIVLRKPLASNHFKFYVDLVDIIAGASAVFLAVLNVRLQHIPWYLTNLSGFAFCYGSLQFMTPGTPAIGSLLLSLLFLYDIYMVFYTPMMVTVATKLDVPIKLLFPRPDDGTCPQPIGALPESQEMDEYRKCLAKKRTMAMLGLGDIVVPGIMIAYALRFDIYNHYRKLSKVHVSPNKTEDSCSKQTTEEKRPTYLPARGMWAERFYTSRRLWSSSLAAKSFPKPYFNATLCGYVTGLVATILIMQVFKHAQPALLYLVPGVLSAFWGVALWRGEVRVLWHYDESQEENEIEKTHKQEHMKKDEKLIGKKDLDSDDESAKPARPNREADLKKPILSLSVFLLSSKNHEPRPKTL